MNLTLVCISSPVGKLILLCVVSLRFAEPVDVKGRPKMCFPNSEETNFFSTSFVPETVKPHCDYQNRGSDMRITFMTIESWSVGSIKYLKR